MSEQPLIMVVDDEPILTETLAEILRLKGYRTVSAINGKVALQLAEQARPDLVICDVLLPGISGVDVANQLRGILPHAPIILFSGQASAEGVIEESRANGNNFDVMAKPMRPEHLIELIGRRLREGRERRQSATAATGQPASS